ncbi:MAG TPA: ABC transporter permease [Candidatus Polarisedimenticolia bacterium]|nr:ABC transporter permease [Candidatus Polarisedimenticolia bacterium]
MNALTAVFRLSLSVLMRSRRTVIMGLLCFLPVLGSVLGAVLVAGRIGPNGVTGFGITSFMIVNVYVNVLLIVVTLFYGTALVSDEYEEKTITYLFMRPVTKTTLYLGKYLAYVVVALALLVPSATLTFLVAMTADPAGEAARHLPILFQDLSLIALGVLAYGALYALIGAMTKRPIIVGIGFAAVWESIVTFIPGYLNKLTIKHYLLALLPHAAGERGITGIFETATTGTTAVAVLLVTTLGLLALGSWMFTNKEYVLEQ